MQTGNWCQLHGVFSWIHDFGAKISRKVHFDSKRVPTSLISRVVMLSRKYWTSCPQIPPIWKKKYTVHCSLASPPKFFLWPSDWILGFQHTSQISWSPWTSLIVILTSENKFLSHFYPTSLIYHLQLWIDHTPIIYTLIY